MNDFVFLLRRELWEHRALVIAPLVFLILIVLAATVGLARGHSHGLMPLIVDHLAGASDSLGDKLGAAGLAVWGLLSWIVTIVVAFYLLDCLYADRKDRSVLFWKSLPISDTRTVLSKLVIACVVAPVIIALAAIVAWLALLLVASVAVMLGGGNPVTILWSQFPLPTMIFTVLSLELLVSLWFLPLIGWLMFASATARKTPFLLAVLVPLGVGVMEKLAFNSEHALNLVGDYGARFFDNIGASSFGIRSHGRDGVEMTGRMPDMADLVAPLTDPALYAGLAVGVAFIAGAIVMRQRRVDAG